VGSEKASNDAPIIDGLGNNPASLTNTTAPKQEEVVCAVWDIDEW
jgi:hypothetical protein